jgi:hypothetical protein
MENLLDANDVQDTLLPPASTSVSEDLIDQIVRGEDGDCRRNMGSYLFDQMASQSWVSEEDDTFSERVDEVIEEGGKGAVLLFRRLHEIWKGRK